MKIFKFEVDEAVAKKHNELMRDSGRLRLSGLIMGMLLVLAGIATYMFIESEWRNTIGLGLGLFSIMCMYVSDLAARKVGIGHVLYSRFPLAAAVVEEVNERDMVLMALVNANVYPNLPPRWA